MLHGEHHVSLDRETITDEEPIGIGLINVHVCWLIWGWRVGICVRRVDFDANVPFVCTDGEKHTHARLFNA